LLELDEPQPAPIAAVLSSAIAEIKYLERLWLRGFILGTFLRKLVVDLPPRSVPNGSWR